VWPFTESKFAAQHCLAAFKGKALEASLRSASRQMPLYALLKSIVVRHTQEVLQLPAKTVQDVPGEMTAPLLAVVVPGLLHASWCDTPRRCCSCRQRRCRTCQVRQQHR
jgi:hypothetical protein